MHRGAAKPMVKQPYEGTPTPDTVPDYSRAAALPFGMAPAAVTPSDLSTWLGLLGVDCAFSVFRHPEDQALDPDYKGHYFYRDPAVADPDGLGGAWDRDFRGGRLARLLPIANVAESQSSESLVVPRRWSPYKVSGAIDITEDLEPVTDAQLAQIVFDPRQPATPGIVWDDRAAAAAALPIPKHADESLIIYGRPTAPVPPHALLWAPLTGALVDPYDPNEPLLATSTGQNGSLNGELDRLLLRAPASGSVRFERYQHIVRTESGQFVLRRPSASGRLVLDAAGLSSLDESRLKSPQLFVIENVEASSLAACFGPLVYDQFRRFIDLVNARQAPPAMYGQLGRALRLWLAVFDLAAGVAAVPSGLRSELEQRLTWGTEPSKQKVVEAIEAIAAQDGWDALKTFITAVYAPVLAGTAWGEVDPALALTANTELTADDSGTAKSEIVMFEREAAGWVSCFAGAPLGQPSNVWMTAPFRDRDGVRPRSAHRGMDDLSARSPVSDLDRR